MDVLHYRLTLQDNGWLPIPCNGKAPTLREWQNTSGPRTAEEMREWCGPNTGIVLGRGERPIVAVDLDVLDPEAASRIEEVVRGQFSDGEILVRTGLAPKRAVLFMADGPFSKMRTLLKDPAGSSHKIEVLCAGQQIVVAGTHPDTGRPYAWHADRSPENVRPDALPKLTADDAISLLALLEEMLVEEYGFERISETKERRGPIDVEARLAALTPGAQGGDGIHDIEVSLSSAYLNRGMTVDEAVKQVLDDIHRADDGTLNWEKEERVVRRMCYDWVCKNPNLDYALPDDVRMDFKQKVANGCTSISIVCPAHIGRFQVRGWGGKKEENNVVQFPKPNGIRIIEAVPFRPFDEAQLKPRSWIYGHHYQRGILTGTVGPGGGGKSSLNLTE